MKVWIAAGLLGWSAWVAGALEVSLTPPRLTSLAVTAGGVTYRASASDLAAANQALALAFDQVEAEVNASSAARIGEVPRLHRALANTLTAATGAVDLPSSPDDPPLVLALGTNLALTREGNPSPEAFLNEGDVDLGLATTGLTAQAAFGLDPWVRGLQVSLVAAQLPPLGTSANGFAGSVTQALGGSLVRGRVVAARNLAGWALRWGGVSWGGGILYNRNVVEASVDLEDRSRTLTPVTVQGYTLTGLKAELSGAQLKLHLETEGLVVPLEVSTLVQVLGLVTLRSAVGADLAWSRSRVEFGAGADLGLSGAEGTMTPGSVRVRTSSEGGGAWLLPRVSAAAGLAVAGWGAEVPVSWAPTARTWTLGLTLTSAW